jgi:hypothetical protein
MEALSRAEQLKLPEIEWYYRLTEKATGQVTIASLALPLTPERIKKILNIEGKYIVEPMTDEEYQAFVEDMEE